MSGYAQLSIKVFLFLAPFGRPAFFFGRRDTSGIGPIKFILNSLLTLFLAPFGRPAFFFGRRDKSGIG
ncbi:hypothetical protein, partial [Anaerobiospirillum succiniciproducens]|uniref:hypothetical protein n=1 Tax=Anaerobiospirillum succiniciproducens TaxID=13335 RepID=UPI003F8B7B5F